METGWKRKKYWDQMSSQDFKLGRGGSALKKNCTERREVRKFLGYFVWKITILRKKNHIFSNCRGRRENFWRISCEKSRFYAKKSYFFPILGGARAGCAPAWSSSVFLDIARWVFSWWHKLPAWQGQRSLCKIDFAQNKCILSCTQIFLCKYK